MVVVLKNEHGRKRIRQFDSYSEWTDWLLAGPHEKNTGGYLSSHAEHGGSWDLGCGWDDAVVLAQEGWSEAREQIEAIASEVSTKVGTVLADRFDFRFGVTGVTVDVGRMMSGDPECMIDPLLTQQPAESPMVTVVVEQIVSSSVKDTTFMKRGAAVLALMDILRQVGIPAEVWLSTDNGTSLHLVPLVRNDQPIDIDALAFALAHPAHSRRIGFASIEAEEVKVPTGYGHAQERANPFTTQQVAPTIFLGGVHTGSGDAGRCVSDPVGWIIDQLRGAGLEIDD